jgi:hypothetical protein
MKALGKRLRDVLADGAAAREDVADHRGRRDVGEVLLLEPMRAQQLAQHFARRSLGQRDAMGLPYLDQVLHHADEVRERTVGVAVDLRGELACEPQHALIVGFAADRLEQDLPLQQHPRTRDVGEAPVKRFCVHCRMAPSVVCAPLRRHRSVFS